jgi:anti-sigma factor ChrR (cupin superfamily)
MIRKLLISASLAGFLLAVSTQARPPLQNTQTDQQSPKVHSVTGKVTQVETGGKAFSLEVSQGNDKRPMRFVVDKGTTVQGHVAAGTTASVDYQSDSNGQLVALSVSEQSSQPQ